MPKPDVLTLPFGERTLLMGVLNVTPDSFSDGGRFLDLDAAVTQGRRLVAEGADILDIGGESTRPGATPVGAEEEIDRVVPVIRALASELDVPISVDTYKRATAAAALEAGAAIINDVWGFQRDPDIARVAAEHGAMSVLMHNRPHRAPVLDPIRPEVADFLARSIDIATAAGLARDRIVLDPGIGFGKSPEQNLELATDARWLKAAFGLPVLIGASRKRLIARLTGAADMEDRLYGSIALHVLAAAAGADVIRAHDVRPHRDALRVVDAARRLR